MGRRVDSSNQGQYPIPSYTQAAENANPPSAPTDPPQTDSTRTESTTRGESVEVTPNLTNEGPGFIQPDVGFPDINPTPSIAISTISSLDPYGEAKELILNLVNGNLSPEDLVKTGVDFSNILEQIVEDHNIFTQGNSRETLIQIADLLLHEIKGQGNDVDEQLKVMLDQVLDRIGEDIRNNRPIPRDIDFWRNNPEHPENPFGPPGQAEQQLPADDPHLQNLLQQLDENQAALEGIEGVQNIQNAVEVAATSLMYDPVGEATSIVDEMVRLAQGNEGTNVSIYELKDHFKNLLSDMTPEQLLEVAGHMSNVLAEEGAEAADGRVAYLLQRHVLPALQNARPTEEISTGIEDIRSRIEGIDIGNIEDMIQVDNVSRAKELIDEIANGGLSPAETLQKSMEFARVMEEISETEVFSIMGGDRPTSQMLEVATYLSDKMAQTDNQTDKSLGVLMNEVANRIQEDTNPYGGISIEGWTEYLHDGDSQDVNEAAGLLEELVALNNSEASDVEKDDRRMEIADRFQEVVQSMSYEEQVALLRHMNTLLMDDSADNSDVDISALLNNYVIPELQPRIYTLGEPEPWGIQPLPDPGFNIQPEIPHYNFQQPNIIVTPDSPLQQFLPMNERRLQ